MPKRVKRFILSEDWWKVIIPLAIGFIYIVIQALWAGQHPLGFGAVKEKPPIKVAIQYTNRGFLVKNVSQERIYNFSIACATLSAAYNHSWPVSITAPRYRPYLLSMLDPSPANGGTIVNAHCMFYHTPSNEKANDIYMVVAYSPTFYTSDETYQQVEIAITSSRHDFHPVPFWGHVCCYQAMIDSIKATLKDQVIESPGPVDPY